MLKQPTDLNACGSAEQSQVLSELQSVSVSGIGVGFIPRGSGGQIP